MKNFHLFALLFVSLSGFAQCNLDLALTSNKTEYLDSTGVVERAVDENSTIEIIKKQILINPGNNGNIMTGNITSTTCDWVNAYKEGKSVIKADFEDPSGGTMHATMTLEGKDGKVTFLMAVAEMPDKLIRVTIDSFKEKK